MSARGAASNPPRPLSLPAMKSRLHRGRLRLVAELKKGAAS